MTLSEFLEFYRTFHVVSLFICKLAGHDGCMFKNDNQFGIGCTISFLFGHRAFAARHATTASASVHSPTQSWLDAKLGNVSNPVLVGKYLMPLV